MSEKSHVKDFKITDALMLIINNAIILAGVFFFGWSGASVILCLLIETAVLMVLSSLIIATLPARSGIPIGQRIFSLIFMAPRLFILLAFITAQLGGLEAFFGIETLSLLEERTGAIAVFKGIIDEYNLWLAVFSITLSAIVGWVISVSQASSIIDFKKYAKRVELTPLIRMGLTQFTVVLGAMIFSFFDNDVRVELLVIFIVAVKASVEFRLQKKGTLAY